MTAKRFISIFIFLLLLLSLFSCENDKKPQVTTAVEESEKPSDTSNNIKEPPAEFTELNKDELQAIEDYLNKFENNGFVGSINLYTKPSEINLLWVFYDGAGISQDSSSMSEQEKQDVLAATGWEEFYNAPTKIPAALANEFVQGRCGLSLKDFGGAISDFHYVEKYDAYYTMHGDTNYDPVTVLNGKQNNHNGNLIIEYTTEYAIEGKIYTVTLRDVGEIYQFVSNVKNS